MTFTLGENSALSKPVMVGSLQLANRIFMAPLSGTRAEADAAPSPLAAEYYAQRAAAGLIISEATAVSRAAGGADDSIPGIYTDRHQAVWAEVAAAVHARGGKMFVQLWHVGRMAHPLISGDDFARVTADFRAAARRAVDAGLDGVEIHAADGHLLHQFLSGVVNRRTDTYGGSAANRARLAAEVVEAVADEIGAGRVGLRISPGNAAGDVSELDVVSAHEELLCRIAPLRIAYLHVLADPAQPAFAAVRTQWDGRLVLNIPGNAGPNIDQAESLADWGVISAAAFGRIDHPASADQAAKSA